MNHPAPTAPFLGPDDPRLTAYALDALDPADRALVEAALATDPTLRAVVDETRAAAATLTAALPREGATLTALQRQAILLRSNARPGGLRRWTSFMLGSSAAAALLLGISLGTTTRVERAELVTRESSSRTDGPLIVGYAAGGPPTTDTRVKFEELLGAHAGARRATTGADAVKVEFVERLAKIEAEVAAAPDTLEAERVSRVTAENQAASEKDAQAAALARLSKQLAAEEKARVHRKMRITPVTAEECAEISPSRTHWVKVGDGYELVTERQSAGGEAYTVVEESPFLRVADARLSTFSIDVDTASYANVRRMLTAGQRPPPAAIRVEELLNYFPYEYPAPTGTDPFAVHLEVAECPWDGTHRLVRVGIQGRPLERKARPPMNLVFLVDVSGSMDAPNKLPLVQASLRMLLEELNERDSVAIVVYAGASGLALAPTWCEQKASIQRAIDDLKSGGSTNGAAGLELAYEIATQRFVKDGVNRVVLATDGDFNVGVTSQDALHALITSKAKSGVFLTCLGFGMGNLKDATLELLADKGNGNYGYIDSTREARKVLVDEASGTLVTIAKDVKLQVEFNPATVASYRLIGYDNRRLADRDFADDTKDAGEVGAGHRVTALYEVVPVGAPDPAAAAAPTGEEPLRYGAKPEPVAAPAGPTAPGSDLAKELLTVKVRWKEPAGTVSTKREFPLVDGGASYGKASRDFRFAASVAAFAMLLRGSPYAARISWDAVAEWASDGLAFDPGAYRAEFVDLIAKAKALPR